MGFLGRGMGAGIGAGLNQASRGYLDAVMFDRERRERTAQQDYLNDLRNQEEERRRRDEAAALAEEARQKRVSEAIGGMFAPYQQNLPVMNTATGQPITGAVGGPTQTVFPKPSYEQMMSVPEMKWQERALLLKMLEDREEQKRKHEAILEEIRQRGIERKNVKEYDWGERNKYQERGAELRKEIKATPAGATTHIARKEGGGGTGSKKGTKPAVVDSERANAEAAIAAGRDPIKVKALYQMRTGKRW